MQTAAYPSPPSLQGTLVRGAGLCLALGVADAMMAVLGSLLMPGGTLSADLAGRLMLGGSLLRGASVAAMGLIALGGQRLLPAPGPRRWVGLGLQVLLATGAGWWLTQQLLCDTARAFGYEARYAKHCIAGLQLPQWTPLMLARHAQYALLMVGLVEFLQRSRHAAEALHEARLRELELSREQAAGQAQLLQAQIEPHFLFNTLANLRRLLRTDPSAAAVLLGDLRRYLAEALPRLREADSTLGCELELVRAYLDLHAVRMGPRLRYAIDVPAALHARPLPPMLLLTLVENALQHGLQPLPEGSRIDVSARADAGCLTLTVGDTGRGMGEAIGSGTGLANIRSRLRALHGRSAALTLQVNEPRGVQATITLPQGGGGMTPHGAPA